MPNDVIVIFFVISIYLSIYLSIYRDVYVNQGGKQRGPSCVPAGMPPTEFACAVCPRRGGHREVREVATPLYGETFGAGVTGPTRRLCSKHAWVVGRQLSGPKRTELYLSLVQQQPGEWHALLARSLAGGREVRCPIQCTCTRLTNPPPTHPRHVQVPASVLRDAAVAGLPDLTAHPGTGAAVERRATREEAAHLLLAGERVMACWQGGARWEPGEVLSVRKSPASCAVLFDDQCYEANVPCASVRRMTADEEVHAQRARATQFMGMEARARARTPVCAKVHECWCCLPSGLPVLALEQGAPTTLHPTPHTLHPTPYTLHPTRCASKRHVEVDEWGVCVARGVGELKFRVGCVSSKGRG